MIRSFYDTQSKHPAWYFLEINTDRDHVHILMEFPPSDCIADVVRELKARSSFHLRQKFKFIDKVFGKSGVWGVGYFVSTIGLNEKIIKKYIWLQGVNIPLDITSEFE
jgi:putative transposase